jgi:HAD superfamily hydrolase (TIGR01509 family)
MIRGVFFDMDGTITEPLIDWRALRDRVGVPEGVAIMAHIESLEGEARQAAAAALEAEETHAAAAAALNAGAARLLTELRQNGIRTALITNNHRQAMLLVVRRFGLEFDLLLCREDAPLKPAPDLVLLALDRLGLQPGEACFIGDGQYDLLASRGAGVRYVHLLHPGSTPPAAELIHHLGETWERLGLRPPATGRTPPESDTGSQGVST